MNIAELDRQTFVQLFGGVYEHSAWISEKCFDKGMHLNITSAENLAGPMSQLVNSADTEIQMALLRAHPDLAGKLATSGTLTAESTSEQSGAGLDECTPEEFSEFTQLNADYREKFGFPYILAVKGRHRTEILENFKARLPNDIGVEFVQALNQVHQIAKLRLAQIT